MLNTLILSALICALPSHDRDERMIYPSGIKDYDAINAIGNPISKYPVLSLQIDVTDQSGNEISPGMYQAKLSEDKTQILLIESGNIVGKLPIIQSLAFGYKNSVPEISASLISPENKKLLVILKTEDLQLYGILYANCKNPEN